MLWQVQVQISSLTYAGHLRQREQSCRLCQRLSKSYVLVLRKCRIQYVFQAHCGKCRAPLKCNRNRRQKRTSQHSRLCSIVRHMFMWSMVVVSCHVSGKLARLFSLHVISGNQCRAERSLTFNLRQCQLQKGFDFFSTKSSNPSVTRLRRASKCPRYSQGNSTSWLVFRVRQFVVCFCSDLIYCFYYRNMSKRQSTLSK